MTETLVIAAVSAAAAIIGGLVSGAYQHGRDWFSRPKLQIDYQDTAANRTEASFTNDAGTAITEYYVRARVRNLGRRTARGAQVFLTSLKEVYPGGTRETSFHDSMPLAWAGWNFIPREIPPAADVHFYVDVVRVSTLSEAWLLCVQKPLLNQAPVKSYRGTYRFHLTAIADNAAPAEFKIDVTYHGNYKNLSAVAVSERRKKTVS
jgi:hypothetical protein